MKRFLRAPTVRNVVAISVFLTLAAAGAGLQSGHATPSTKYYSTTVSGSAAAGATFTATITLTNSSDSSQTLGSEDVVLPLGYAATTAGATASAAGWGVTLGSWSLSDGTHTSIQLRSGNGSALSPGASVTATVAVTVPCTQLQDTTWKTEAKQSNSFSGPPGNDFLATPGTYTSYDSSTHLYSLPYTPGGGSCSFRFVDPTSTAAPLPGWTPSSSGYRAGVGFAVKIEALDGLGHRRTGYTGPATMSGLSDSVNGDSPTYGSGDSGSHTVSFGAGLASFTVTAVRKETAHLTVTDGSLTADSLPFDVWPGDPAALDVGSVPRGVVNQALDPAVTVDVFDAYGNKEDCATCTQASVTLNLVNDAGYDALAIPTGTTLTDNGPTSSVLGTATFDGLALNRSGTGFTIDATSGTITSPASNGFDIYDNLCDYGPSNPYGQCDASKNNTSISVDYPTQTIDSTLLQLSALGKSLACGGGSTPAIGAVVTFQPASKDTANAPYDYKNPIQVTLRWDKTLVPGTGVSNFTLCLAKPTDSTWGPANTYKVVQDCPAKLKANTLLPCASKRSRNNAGDLVIILLMGSDDPIAGLG